MSANLQGDPDAKRAISEYVLGTLRSYRKRLLVDISGGNYVVPTDFFARGIMHEDASNKGIVLQLSAESALGSVQALEPNIPYAMEVVQVGNAAAGTTVTGKIWLLA